MQLRSLFGISAERSMSMNKGMREDRNRKVMKISQLD